MGPSARRTLTRVGCTVVEAGNGRAALDQYERMPEPPPGVVLDVAMPIMGGAEGLLELRARGSTAPVLLISGHDAGLAPGSGDRTSVLISLGAATNRRRRVFFGMTVASITDGTFSADVLAHPGLVVVDIWAEWCTPCRALVPIFETLADRYAGRVRVVKLDADANVETVTRFDVRALPTVLVFQRGVLVERLSGARALGTYVDAIEAHLARGDAGVIAVPSVERIVAAPPPVNAESDSIREARVLLASGEATLVFKHSNSCPVSFTAKRQYDQFVAANPAVHTRLVIVQRERDLSNALETVSRLRHESPQALIVRDGRVLWDASHGGITAPRLEQAFTKLQPPA